MKAWAVTGKKSGKVLADLAGHYAIYRYKKDADADCPKYGIVRQITVYG